MSVWMIRAGRNGLYESDALDNGRSYINYSLDRDVRDFRSRDALRNYLCNLLEYRDSGKDPVRMAGQNASQLLLFAHTIERGDIVVLPRYTDPRVVAIGYIAGDYVFRPDLSGAGHGHPGPHMRDVNWLVRDVPLADFPPDLRDALGRQGTVRRISVQDAEHHVREIMENHLN